MSYLRDTFWAVIYVSPKIEIDGMKYYFQNPLNRRRAAILDSYEYMFVSAKSLILRFLARCNRNENVGL